MSKLRRAQLRVVSTSHSALAPTRGKVIHDPRGNAVWDWGLESKELEATSTTGLLRKLSGGEALALEIESVPTQGTGFDPYNRKRG